MAGEREVALKLIEQGVIEIGFASNKSYRETLKRYLNANSEERKSIAAELGTGGLLANFFAEINANSDYEKELKEQLTVNEDYAWESWEHVQFSLKYLPNYIAATVEQLMKTAAHYGATLELIGESDKPKSSFIATLRYVQHAATDPKALKIRSVLVSPNLSIVSGLLEAGSVISHTGTISSIYTRVDRNAASIVVDFEEDYPGANCIVAAVPLKKKTEECWIPKSPKFVPPLMKNGCDNDWDEGFDFSVEAEVERVDNEIRVRESMTARERETDWTEVRGQSEWRTVYRAPEGWRISGVKKLGSVRHEGLGEPSENDPEKASKGFGENEPSKSVKMPNNWLVSEFLIDGFKGDDAKTAGNHTGVTVTYRPIIVELEESSD